MAMLPTEWIDKVRARTPTGTVYATAKALSMTTSAVQLIIDGRTTSLRDSTCVSVAKALELDPIVVLLDQQLTSTDPDILSAYRRLLDLFNDSTSVAETTSTN